MEVAAAKEISLAVAVLLSQLDGIFYNKRTMNGTDVFHSVKHAFFLLPTLCHKSFLKCHVMRWDDKSVLLEDYGDKTLSKSVRIYMWE